MTFAVALIPVYNHTTKIGAVLDGCLKHLNAEDIIVVDDGSTDFSATEAAKRRVHIRRHGHNMGKGRALITGFTWAIGRGAEWVLTIDADGQHLPEEIPIFLSAAKEGKYDLIIGKRDILLGKMPFTRYLSNSLSSRLLSRILGQSIEDSQCGFRMIRTELLKGMNLKTNDYMLETEIILFAARRGASIGFVPVSTVYGDEKSHMGSMRTIARLIRTIWINRKSYTSYLKK